MQTVTKEAHEAKGCKNLPWPGQCKKTYVLSPGPHAAYKLLVAFALKHPNVEVLTLPGQGKRGPNEKKTSYVPPGRTWLGALKNGGADAQGKFKLAVINKKLKEEALAAWQSGGTGKKLEGTEAELALQRGMLSLIGAFQKARSKELTGDTKQRLAEAQAELAKAQAELAESKKQDGLHQKRQGEVAELTRQLRQRNTQLTNAMRERDRAVAERDQAKTNAHNAVMKAARLRRANAALEKEAKAVEAALKATEAALKAAEAALKAAASSPPASSHLNHQGVCVRRTLEAANKTLKQTSELPALLPQQVSSDTMKKKHFRERDAEWVEWCTSVAALHQLDGSPGEEERREQREREEKQRREQEQSQRKQFILDCLRDDPELHKATLEFIKAQKRKAEATSSESGAKRVRFNTEQASRRCW